MIFAPRSWPSRPGFATRTRIGGVLGIELGTEERVYLAGGRVGYPPPPGGYLAGKYLWFVLVETGWCLQGVHFKLVVPKIRGISSLPASHVSANESTLSLQPSISSYLPL